VNSTDRERIIEALVRAGGQEHMVNVSEAHFARLGDHRVNDRDNVTVGQCSLGRLETHLRSLAQRIAIVVCASGVLIDQVNKQAVGKIAQESLGIAPACGNVCSGRSAACRRDEIRPLPRSFRPGKPRPWASAPLGSMALLHWPRSPPQPSGAERKAVLWERWGAAAQLHGDCGLSHGAPQRSRQPWDLR
jgi:hypothetical protein